MEIEFAGKLTEADFRRIQMLAMRKVWLVFGGMFGVMVVVNLLSGMGRALARNPLDAVLTWMPIVLVIPVVAVLQWFGMRRHWRNNRTVQHPVNGLVSDEGITWNVEGLSSSKLPWHLLLGVSRHRITGVGLPGAEPGVLLPASLLQVGSGLDFVQSPRRKQVAAQVRVPRFS